jgi:hypothetical protein
MDAESELVGCRDRSADRIHQLKIDIARLADSDENHCPFLFNGTITKTVS